MLDALQRQLSDIYQAAHAHDVRDYLITDPTLARALGREALLTNTEETLLVAEDDEGLALSLFLDGELLSRLESAKPLDNLRAESLDDLWKVLEGVSHFHCVAWKAMQDRPVSLLELELQGEIDKYVSTMLLALGQSDTELPRRLHGWLFDNVRYHEELDEEQYERYRSANEYAARFCHRLRRRLVHNAERALGELRDFYRMQLSEKISHIHSRAWAQA
jgi:hypothetical protein